MPWSPLNGHFTGRLIATFADPMVGRVRFERVLPSDALATTSGLRVEEAVQRLSEGGVVEIGDSGIFVYADDDERASTVALDAQDTGEAEIEPEMFVYPSTDIDRAYVRGARDALDLLLRPGEQEEAAAGAANAPRKPREDDDDSTWGLKAVGADRPTNGGAGIRVAVLDTGIDHSHPAFAGRIVATASFIVGEPVDDGHGHGTHCAGTIGGATTGPRYGVASRVSLVVGKVLSDAGVGTTASILAAIEWAVTQKAQVISMSLGSKVTPTTPFSPAYERAATRALDAGVLIVAAAGNNSLRSWDYHRPVSSPANCPSVLAVAAVDTAARVADFSNRGMVAGGGEVNLAGPGVGVLSAAPGGGSTRMSGTSMATPHVAGVAAVLAAGSLQLRGRALWQALVGRSTPILGASSADVGAGSAHV